MNINDLPEVIVDLIKEFIPLIKLVFVNKTFYNLNHSKLYKFIPLYENYTRDMIRRDNSFVFEKIVIENFDIWIRNKQYRYKNMIFNNYIYFIHYFCIENNSERCREVINIILKERDLSKNLHKKNVFKYIKWIN